MDKYYEVLKLLAEIASEHTDNTYNIVDSALGFIPFKNKENKVKEVGARFIAVAHWLLQEMEG